LLPETMKSNHISWRRARNLSRKDVHSKGQNRFQRFCANRRLTTHRTPI
jgi:hypothetical protein